MNTPIRMLLPRGHSLRNKIFAVTFVTLRSGAVRAQIQDGIYEGYHHNDIMNTKPYESKTYKKAIVLTESKLRRIITESVRNILNRLLS